MITVKSDFLRRTALCLATATILVTCLASGAAHVFAQDLDKNIQDAMRQAQELAKQYDTQKQALDDLTNRKAPYEVLRYYESKCRETQRRTNILQNAVEGWKAQQLGGTGGRAAEMLAGYAALQKEDVRIATLRKYCAARSPKGSPQEAADMEKGWDEAFRQETKAIAAAYLDLTTAQSSVAPVEMAQLMVKRRILEDRLNALDQALYIIQDRKGQYVVNPDFDKEYEATWRPLLLQPSADSVGDLSKTVSSSRTAVQLMGEKVAELRHSFMVGYFDGEAATNAMDLNQLVAAAASAKRGAELIKELGKDLDELDAMLAPRLTRLGYDARLEDRRPITFDKTGNPSDLTFILDARAGDFLKVLEGDAEGRPYGPSTDKDGKVALSNPDKSAPDVAKGGTYGTYTVNLYNHENNIGLPGEFWKDATPDMLAQSAAGDTNPRTVNIWHPRVREFTQKYFEAFGRAFHADPAFLLYDHVTWEPAYSVNPKTRKTPFFGYAVKPGYDEIGKKAFRDWLKAKFGDIETLNKAWGAQDKSFDEIVPPTDPFMEWRRRATPLSYEHEMFLRESLADYVGLACGAIMKGDASHPVIHEMPGMMDYAVESCFANVPLLTRVPAQMVEMHANTFWPALAQQVYAATVIPMYGKVPVHTEFMWNWGRRVTPTNESEVYYQGLQTIWRNAAYGIRVLAPFAYYNWPAYENGYSDWLVTKNWQTGWGEKVGEILRDSSASIAVGARRARRFGEILHDTKLAPREVAIIQPSTSTANAYPYYGIGWSFNVHTIESKIFNDLLFNKNYQYGYVPEEAFSDGHAKMEDYPALILPYASYFPDGFNEKLLAYVRQGGVVIASGVPGLYDKYGRDDGKFVKEVLGDLDVKYSGNNYIWQFDITPRKLTQGCLMLGPAVEADGKALLMHAKYGKGLVLISAIPFGQRPRSELLAPYLYSAINEGIGSQLAKCAFDRFELVLREGGGKRFLCVCNYSLGNTLEDLITVKGEYSHLVDRGIGPKFQILPLPRKPNEALKTLVDQGVFYLDSQSPPGHTSFWLRLQPGEATIIELAK